MKQLLKIILIGALLGSVGSSVLMADIKKGQKAYLKTFKSKFKMNGTKFATLHTQDEWKELFKNKGEGFKKEFIKNYPKSEKTLLKKNIWKKLQDVKDFAIEYANDSGNIPSCG
ncbi:hypothetical protein JHD50_10745 [Sulfurimonas sp. MAG313]|nr:hypothetical protein [Sulfurimonas sp. MAG313]MDF1881770.1 hypothetical protein [Sulfurimonas sp. MAG313]